jgi:hypothetical protein
MKKCQVCGKEGEEKNMLDNRKYYKFILPICPYPTNKEDMWMCKDCYDEFCKILEKTKLKNFSIGAKNK